MEIERKFLLKNLFTSETLLKAYMIQQSYLASVGDIEVRIRSKLDVETQWCTYKMCIKSSGDLCREEVELDIPEEEYFQLVRIIDKDPISKFYFLHGIESEGKEYEIEVSIVDIGRKGGFVYAEVEFDSVEEANQFDPSKVFVDYQEVTTDSYWKMKNYWNRTRNERLRNHLTSPNEINKI